MRAEAHPTVGRMVRAEREPTTMPRLLGPYGTVARRVDALAALSGVVLGVDGFLVGMEQFGTRILPPMTSRPKLWQAA